MPHSGTVTSASVSSKVKSTSMGSDDLGGGRVRLRSGVLGIALVGGGGGGRVGINLRGNPGSRSGATSPVVDAVDGVGGNGFVSSTDAVELLRFPWIPMRAERAARAETRRPFKELMENRADEREPREALERMERFERAETVEASELADARRKKEAWIGVAEGPANACGGGGRESGRAGGIWCCELDESEEGNLRWPGR